MTIQCEIIQYDTIQCEIIQCDTAQCDTIQCDRIQFDTIIFINCDTWNTVSVIEHSVTEYNVNSMQNVILSILQYDRIQCD